MDQVTLVQIVGMTCLLGLVEVLGRQILVVGLVVVPVTIHGWSQRLTPGLGGVLCILMDPVKGLMTMLLFHSITKQC